jgi:hypothetical protein
MPHLLGNNGEASTLCVSAQWQEMGLRVLSTINGRDPGIDGGELHASSILLDTQHF